MIGIDRHERAIVASERSPEYRASIAVAVEAIGTFATATKFLARADRDALKQGIQ
jgi:hypothetical protein